MERKSARKKTIECKFCGAKFPEMSPSCPYCGNTNIKGAEAEYMNQLEGIRADMSDLNNVPLNETKKEIKKQTKFVLIVVGIILGLFLLLVLFELLFGYKEEKRDHQADYIWKQENFPLLDELYEQGRYEELVARYIKAYEEGYPISGWEHYEFAAAMDLFLEVEEIWEAEEIGYPLNKWDYADLLYIGFRIEQYEESSAYSQEDKEKMAPYIARVREDFNSRWGFTEEDLQMFSKEKEKNYGYVPYNVIDKYVEDWMDREGK